MTRAELRRPHKLLVMAAICVVDVTGLSQASAADKQKRDDCPALPGLVDVDYMHHPTKGVIIEDPNHFVSMQIDGEAVLRYGKVLRFRTANGPRYVIFEMAGPVEVEAGRRKSEVTRVTKLCRHMYRGRTEVEPSQQGEVLFRLHLPAP